MSDAPHTPLPWVFDRIAGEIYYNDHDGAQVFPLIATINSEDVSPDQAYADGDFIAHACNSHYELLKALEDAFTLLARISDTLHYEEGLPVTALEARDIEIIYGDAVTELVRLETLIRDARGRP